MIILNRVTSFYLPCAAALILAGLAAPERAHAQLPEGPGRAEMEKLCKNCHELARSVSKKQDRDGWQQTMAKMVAFGMRGSDDEYKSIVDYLVKHYPADPVPPINLNTASAIELESRLSLRRSHAKLFLAYRDKVGKISSLEEVKKIPGVDYAKFEAKRDRIVF